MRWLNEPLLIDAAVAAAIADDLQVIAEADGEVHERESALIEAFRSGIPPGADASKSDFSAASTQRTYIRSLLLLALADGELRDEETDMIATLARQRGVAAEEVMSITRALTLEFYGTYGGASGMREDLRQAAASAGVRREQTDTMWN